jgi:hypothetical protein
VSTNTSARWPRSKPIPFVCRYAMVCNDVSNENFYVFLVPDEGTARCHYFTMRLYRGPLAPSSADALLRSSMLRCDEPRFKTHQGPVRLLNKEAQHGRVSRPPDNLLASRRQNPRRSCSATLGQLKPVRPRAAVRTDSQPTSKRTLNGYRPPPFILTNRRSETEWSCRRAVVVHTASADVCERLTGNRRDDQLTHEPCGSPSGDAMTTV